MTLALYELAYRKEIQDKLRKEINDVMKRHNNEITYDAIHEMNYLDQVVNGMISICLLIRCRTKKWFNEMLGRCGRKKSKVKLEA